MFCVNTRQRTSTIPQFLERYKIMKARLERTSCVFGNEHVTALMKSGELKRFAPVEDLSFLPLPAG